MIKNELNTLKETIQNIKTQIINKGQIVLNNTPLAVLSQKIENISNGGQSVVHSLNEIITGDIKELVDDTCTYLRPNCFRNCTKLEKATFYSLTKICSFTFYSCYRLHTLLLPGNFVHLDDINAFRYTLLYNLQGNIYVNPDYYTQYINDSVWKYFKSIIKPCIITTTISINLPNTIPTGDTYQFM